MLDLYIGMMCIWLVAIIVFVVVRRTTMSFTCRQRTWLAVCVMAAGTGYVVFIRDSVLLARLFPFSNLIVLTTWFPIFCGALAALASQPDVKNRLRRILPTAALACLGIFTTIQPLLGAVPRCTDMWDDDVCRQSSWHSCSAACAATLLKQHDIAATEAELAELCLTRKGTTWQGLFRGMMLKTRGTPWRVEVSHESPPGIGKRLTSPAIISVGVPAGVDVDPIYTQTYGWPAGQLHSVVLLGFGPDGKPDIADPSVGRESWSAKDFDVLFRGIVMRLTLR